MTTDIHGQSRHFENMFYRGLRTILILFGVFLSSDRSYGASYGAKRGLTQYGTPTTRRTRTRPVPVGGV